MTLHRGDVILVSWPNSSGVGTKSRPALVVQNDRDNVRLTNTILAMITTVTRRSLEATQMLIEISTPEGALAGLRKDSVVNCVNLFTVEQTRIIQTIGKLPKSLLRQIDDCLKVALEL